MKALVSFILCLTITAKTFSQKTEWKEMVSFHEVMAKTFHPAEDGNLQPTKDNIDVLITRARAWQASTAPAGYKAKSVKPLLDTLVKQCVAIKDAITQKKSDDTLQKMISSAHDTYHEILKKTK